MDLAGGVRFTLELQPTEKINEKGEKEPRDIIKKDQDEAKAVLERRLSDSAVSDVSFPTGTIDTSLTAESESLLSSTALASS